MGHRPGGRARVESNLSVRCADPGAEHERWGTPVARLVAGLRARRPSSRSRKAPRRRTEGGNQPADKSLINRRLSLRSQPRAAMAFLADRELAARALDCVRALDGEHKRLTHRDSSRIDDCGGGWTTALKLGSVLSARRAMRELHEFAEEVLDHAPPLYLWHPVR
jgi:hypothetical protein